MTRLGSFVVSGLCLVGFQVSSVGMGYAQEPVVPTLRTPIGEVLEEQTKREEITLEKLRLALDDNAPVSDRVASLSGLGGIEYDYLLANADRLVMEDPEIATRIISIVGGYISMLPSRSHHEGHGNETDLVSYQFDLVDQSEAVLEIALKHPAAEVRTAAATTLAPRNNVAALVALEEMINNGSIEARQGVSYLSLAPSETSAPFLEPYLMEGELEARAAAVSQLAYIPEYTTRVREVALGADTPEEITLAALRGLSQTDDEFLVYAPAIAADGIRSVETREAALRASLEAVTVSESPDKEVLNTVVRSLKQVSESLNTEEALETFQAFESRINQ